MEITEKTILLILGFLFSTVLGGFWGYLLKKRSWQVETEHSIHRARFDEGTAFLDDISILVGKRLFLLQRVLWVIQEEQLEKIEEKERAYFSIVEEWNSKYWRNRNKIRLLVSEEQANYFLDYSDDNAKENPNSLHYKFVIAHRAVMKAKQNKTAIDYAVTQVTQLNWKCAVFLERLTSEFVRRATSLQLLQVPMTPGGAEQQLQPNEKKEVNK